MRIGLPQMPFGPVSHVGANLAEGGYSWQVKWSNGHRVRVIEGHTESKEDADKAVVDYLKTWPGVDA